MTSRIDCIIPECYIDTNLVETLVGCFGCNHQKGCNQVAKTMNDKYANRFAVGVIDADKRQPGYLREFSPIGSSDHLTLFKHGSRPHYILLVSPAADGFILSCAQECGVAPETFGLSSKLKEFTMQTKDVLSNKDVRFKHLFKAISPAREMQLMQHVLTMLANNTYNVSEEDLKASFGK